MIYRLLSPTHDLIFHLIMKSLFINIEELMSSSMSQDQALLLAMLKECHPIALSNKKLGQHLNVLIKTHKEIYSSLLSYIQVLQPR